MARLVILLVILLVLFTACEPPISGDAGTYTNPTPPSGVWQQEMDQHEARATREAR